jgi:hypothetical protein
MAKLTLNTIGSRYGSIDALNDNSDLVEAAFENTLSRDGTGPNNMESDLDMDSNRIINLNNGVHPQDAVTKNQLDTNKAEVNALVQSLSTSPYGDAANVSYVPAGVSAVATTVQTKLRETVSVKDFGAVGDGVTDDTAAIQAAIDYMGANKCELLFPPGTYLVSQVTLGFISVAHPGGAVINAYGAVLQGSGALAPLATYRNQGLSVNGLNVVKHASATYTCELTSFWHNNWTDCRLGAVKIKSEDGWGVYWNEFNNCTIDSLYFDLSEYSINQNIFNGGKCGAITKSNAGHPVFKEAYNNVFIGIDLVGAIDWRDPDAAFRDPLILRDCNFEFGASTNYGFINSVGGRNSPLSTSAVPYPWDNMRSEFRMNDGLGNTQWLTGWTPGSPTNLIRGGAAQSYSPNITTGGAASSFLSIVRNDATSPSLNNSYYRMLVPGVSSSSLRINLPGEFLEEARNVGYVSFSWWEYNVVGGGTIISNVGTGDSSIPGMAIPAATWVKRFATIRLNASSTQCYLQIGGSTVTDFEVRITNVACYIGRFAYPYAPSPSEPYPLRGTTFDKTLVANGSAQNTFTLTIPASDIAGRVIIKATCFDAASVSVYQGELFYARHNTGSQITANVVQNGKAEVSFSGSGDGTISAMAASATGSTVTVTTTISSYAGSPSRSVRYEVEFLDRNETLAVL